MGILRSGPKNGAEIMDQIEQMSLGWRPSPGAVYPLLEELLAEGLLHRREDGRYEVTARARENPSGPWDLFAGQATSPEGLVAEMRSNVSYLEDLSTSSPEKLAPLRKGLKELGDRLNKLGSS